MEKATAPHSSILAWKIPWMEEPGGRQSMGSQRVGHDWMTKLNYLLLEEHTIIYFYWWALLVIKCFSFFSLKQRSQEQP